MRRTSNYKVYAVYKNKKTQCAVSNKSDAPHHLEQQNTERAVIQNK